MWVASKVQFSIPVVPSIIAHVSQVIKLQCSLIMPCLPVKTPEEESLIKAEGKARKNSSWSAAKRSTNGAVLGSDGSSESTLSIPRPLIALTQYWLSKMKVVGSLTTNVVFRVRDPSGQLSLINILNPGPISSAASPSFRRLRMLKQCVTPSVCAPENVCAIEIQIIMYSYLI